MRAKHVLAPLILVVAGAVAGWLWYSGRATQQAERATSTTPAPLPGGTAPTATPALDLPELDASDELVRRLVSGLSSHPRLAGWLASDELVRRFTVAVVTVANGRSPRAQLPFLVPDEDFRARKTGDRLFIDPASYHRYDLLAAIISSLDAEATAQLYRQLHPLFEEAYLELGLNDGTFDDEVGRALGRLLAIHTPDAPVEVEQQGDVYEFSDPELEALGPVEKHVLRMGPANAGALQSKLRDLAQALDITPTWPDSSGPN